MKRTTWRCFGDRPPRSLSHIETTRPRVIDWLQPWSRTPSCTSPPTVLMYGRILCSPRWNWSTGPLFAYEVADKRVAPHVVLSACELGQATTRPGDEALGLTRVLLQLGAQCVVAGVAQVADDLAGRVMADYHRRLATGVDSASALASATASGPYVPFVCFGSSWHAYGGGASSASLG